VDRLIAGLGCAAHRLSLLPIPFEGTVVIEVGVAFDEVGVICQGHAPKEQGGDGCDRGQLDLISDAWRHNTLLLRIDRPGFCKRSITIVTAAIVTRGVQKLWISTTAKDITSFRAPWIGRFFVILLLLATSPLRSPRLRQGERHFH
jgi:hypothetical protein